MIKAKINELVYPRTDTDKIRLKSYDCPNFRIDESESCGIIKINENLRFPYTIWTTPKSTRTYPFANLFKIYPYSAGNKIITFIPVTKDEGSQTQNFDHITYKTLSWMNLMNIYVILYYYSHAEIGKRKNGKEKITNQKIKNDTYIRDQIINVGKYRNDAHHWNNSLFKNSFIPLSKKALNFYKESFKSSQIHNQEKRIKFLKEISKSENKNKLSLEKYKKLSIEESRKAAKRETTTIHERESVSEGSVKGLFEIENNLGGIYHLTCDEIEIQEKIINIVECKNTTKSKLPSPNDIYDGLFKMILFNNIEYIEINDEPFKSKCSLVLTGENLIGELIMPTEEEKINEFIKNNNLNNREKDLMFLNEEAKQNKYKIFIKKNQ